MKIKLFMFIFIGLFSSFILGNINSTIKSNYLNQLSTVSFEAVFGKDLIKKLQDKDNPIEELRSEKYAKQWETYKDISTSQKLHIEIISFSVHLVSMLIITFLTLLVIIRTIRKNNNHLNIK